MDHEMFSPATADRQFPPFSSFPPNRHLTPSQFHKSSADYSVFSPKSPITPSSSVSVDEDEDPSTTENRLYLASLRLQYQDFASRYELCLSHLQDASREAEALRRENMRLRITNGALRERLIDRRTAAASITDDLRKLRIESLTLPAVAESPTSVLEPRVALPKSISVRSTGYKKINVDGKVRVSKPVMVGSQRVYVGGGCGPKKDGSPKAGSAALAADALELEVYNQGMFKTELCNKWQEEKGECPYGDHCQFAHGIGELRPVIRHPRYKTEVCRMVLAGDPCPYGHRCHFRHALSPSDRNPL